MKEKEMYRVIAFALKDMLGDEEQLSNCCTAPFNPPGWPDSDFCSSCGEHADIIEGDETNDNNR